MLKLREKYKKEVIPAMIEKFKYPNVMAVPKITKVVVSTGFGKLISGKSPSDQKKAYEPILEDLSLIIGQALALKPAKKSIAGFKTRKGMILGISATLRGERMFSFLESLIHTALPRMRDFRGIDQKSVDGKGNLNYGIKEHIIFPVILPEKVKTIFGLEVTVVTSAGNKEEGIELFKLMGFPIK